MGSGSSKKSNPTKQQATPKPAAKQQTININTNTNPVVEENQDMYKSYKEEIPTATSNSANGSDVKRETKNEAQKPATGMPWLEILDKVSNLELWEGVNRAERDPWRKYLKEADDIVRRPRKPIPKDVVRSILEGDMDSIDVANVPNAQPRVVVFVSSTFTDTKAERNQLMRDVYPYLRDVCRRLGIEFGTVDMRWGVTEEATNDHSTVEMCINEIKRCVKESIGPAFLCFLGNKYGYRPLPAQIEATEYTTLVRQLEGQGHDTALIHDYYNLDENAVPDNFVLKQKTDDNKTWWEDVGHIQDQFREAAVTCFGAEDSRCSKYHVSVTETEITEGAFKNINQSGQVRFVRRELENYLTDLHQSRKLYDMKDGQTDEYAMEKLKELKERKMKTNCQPDVIYDVSYADHDVATCSEYVRTVCDHVCKELTTAIFQGYENKLHVEEDKEFQESVHHRTHANEKASLFVGREAEIERILAYIKGSENKPLAVHGVSGCGKTALMAVGATKAKAARRESALTLRFLGTSGQSGSARGLLLNLCKQITRIYNEDESKIPTSYKDLIAHFRVCLAYANSSKPLILFLDSLDQLSNEDFGQNLAWLSLSEDLPEHVKLVVSSLPTRCLEILEANLPEESMLEVKPLHPDSGKEIVDKMLKAHDRTVTKAQENLILDAFKQCPLPLFLRLVVDIAVKWRSYDEVNADDIAEDMQGLINKLFLRLESRYGELFVQHALAYITAAKQGLSLAELEDILSCDDEVLTNIFKWWEPPIRRIPPLLWARVRNELGIYLAERGTSGISAYGWYHRQFWETAEQRYLHNTGDGSTTPFFTQAHQAIADYFEGKWAHGKPCIPKGETKERIADRKLPSQSIVVSGDRVSRRQLNKRKLSELPFHLIQLKEWERFQKLVMDLTYVEAKFEAQDGYNCLSELIEATKLSGNDMVKQLTRFVGSNLGFLIREPVAVYQMASQMSSTSPVRMLLDQMENSDLPLPLMKTVDETDYPDPCEMTMYGHTETLRCCDYSPQGDLILSSADDCTMRIWDAVTGAEIVTVTSLPKPIFPPKDAPMQLMLHPVNPSCFSRDGENIASGTELGSVMLWDVTGVQLQCQETSNGSVNYVGFSNDNKYVATAFKNSTVSIWLSSDLSHVTSVNIQWGELTGLDFSPDDTKLAVSCLPGLSIIHTAGWDVASRNRGLSNVTLCCTFHPSGKQVMTGGDDNSVTIWDSSTGAPVGSVRGHLGWIWCIKFTKDGQRMFTCSSDRTMKIWARQSETSWANFVSVGGHSARVSMVALDTSTENKLVTSSLDRSLKVWDKKSLFEGKTPPVGGGHYNVLVTSSKGTYRASSQGWLRTCSLFGARDSNAIGKTAAHTGFIHQARFTVDETKLIVLDHGHTGGYESGSEKHASIQIVSVPDLATITKLSVDSPISVNINSRFILVGTANGTIHLFDVNNYNEVNNWDFGDKRFISDVACNSENNKMTTIAAGAYCCKVWDASDSHCTLVKELSGYKSPPIVCVMNPSGTLLSVGHNSGEIHIYDVTSDDVKLNKVIHDHESYVKDIKFSVSGHYMVSSAGLSMRVWDVKNGLVLKCAYYAPVNNAAFIFDEIVLAGEATGNMHMLTF